MKTIRLYLNKISIFLMFLITLQSCVVYHSKIATVDEAIQSNDKVKIITDSNDVYKLHKLKKEGDQIYGVIKKGSETSERLSDQGLIKDSESKYKTIILKDNTIKEVHLKNKALSTMLTIAVPVVGIGVLIVVLYNSISIDPGITLI